jgi:aminopeptidase N
MAAFLLFASAHAVAGTRVVLPDTVVPTHYRIDFTPDIGALTFTGNVDIEVQVRRATNAIVLNAAELTIDSAALAGDSARPKLTYDEKVETATFTFDKPLTPGAHTLKLTYHGVIHQTAAGLFALDYQDPKAAGKLRALFTQFENSDARRFVPSWDEPGIKATFDLTATIPADQMAISNMPVASTEKVAGGLARVRFARSPKMSTYLLFFSVGDFERVHRTVAGVDVGVVVKRGDTASAAFALDVATDVLPWFNDYFGTPYPLPKLDLVAGPGSSQFFGAMENWGAIFFFEEALLIDPRLATQTDKQGIYGVVAHEIAHQWFGDLVTMAWWDDLWLNEGFASWMSSKVTDHFHPEWKEWLQSLGGKQGVMQRDARDGTHPVIMTIDDVAQASAAFDDITYIKGQAVIRALEFHIGEAEFGAGVRRYMREHMYGNTVTDDLWTALGKESRVPVAQIAHDLTRQAGVPMVNLLSAKCVGKNTTVTLNQTHFAIDASSTSARVWHLPVKIATLGGAPTATIVSGTAPTKVDVAGCGPVILNAGQGGYMRARYTRDALAALAARFTDLTPDDQLGLLNDTRSLASIGDVPMAEYLDLTRGITPAADPVVTSTLVAQLRDLDGLYDGLPTQAGFRAFGRRLLAPMFAQTGWDARAGESANTTILRADLIAALNDFGDEKVVAGIRERFQRYVDHPAEFSPDARRTLLSNVAVRADEKVWERLRAMAKSAKTELERQEFYGLLGAPLDEALIQRAFGLVFSGELETTTGPRIIVRASGRHPEMAVDFAITNWDKLVKQLEVSSANQYVPFLARFSSDPKTIDRLNAFAEARIPPSARQDFVRAISRIRYAADVRAKRLPEVDRWLAAQNVTALSPRR